MKTEDEVKIIGGNMYVAGEMDVRLIAHRPSLNSPEKLDLAVLLHPELMEKLPIPSQEGWHPVRWGEWSEKMWEALGFECGVCRLEDKALKRFRQIEGVPEDEISVILVFPPHISCRIFGVRLTWQTNDLDMGWVSLGLVERTRALDELVGYTGHC